MQSLFEQENYRQLFFEEVKKWNDTAFQYNCAGKAHPGCFADCVSFPLVLFKRIGVIPESFVTPEYLSVSGGREEFTKLIECIENIPTLEKVWERDKEFIDRSLLKLGDLIVCSSGAVVHHVLIYAERSDAWHCWPKIGVAKVDVGSFSIQKYAKRVYRFVREIND